MGMEKEMNNEVEVQENSERGRFWPKKKWLDFRQLCNSG